MGAGVGRWVNVPPDVFAVVDTLVPREDRDLEAPVFGCLDQPAGPRARLAAPCPAPPRSRSAPLA
jgi:hypothetical protein